MAEALKTLQAFKGSVQKLARPNRFLVSIGNPSVGGFTFEEKDKYFVRGVGTPQKNVGDITNLFWFGANLKLAGDPTYPEITLKFLNSESYDIREKFEKWMEAIAGTSANDRGEPEEYKTNMTIDQIGINNDVTASYTCHGVWPKNITGIEFGQETSDSVEEFDVLFNIDFFSKSISDFTGTVDKK